MVRCCRKIPGVTEHGEENMEVEGDAFIKGSFTVPMNETVDYYPLVILVPCVVV
jgi:hypothetical protein